MRQGASDDYFDWRPATTDDIPVVRRVAAETWWQCYRGMISDGQIRYMLDWMYAPEVLRRELQGLVYWLLLVRRVDRAVAGFAAWAPHDGAAARLHKLYVHPDHQRRGGAMLLLEAVTRQVTHAGHSALTLTVNRSNDEALAFYRRAGFVCQGQQCKEIGGGFVMDDYVMALSLEQAAGPATDRKSG